MKRLILRLFTIFLLAVSLFTLDNCRSRPTDQPQETRVDYSQQGDARQSDARQGDARQSDARQGDARHRHHRHKQHGGKHGSATTRANQAPDDQRPQLSQKGAIPQKVYDVLSYVRKNNRAMDGYAGGRRFGNFENLLPKTDASGQPIQYQEWDVNPKIQGQNRGTERLITGSDGRAYFTNDHYNSFTEVK